MQDRERLDLVDNLGDVLAAAGYEGVVRQHTATVEDGRMVEIRPDDLPKSRRGQPGLPKVGDVRRRDLTSEEQISLLIDLVEVAVGGSVAVEERTRGMAAEFLDHQSAGTVSFAVDAAGATESWSLYPAGPERRRAVNAVVETLQELRKVSDVQRAPWLEEHVEERAPGDRIAGGW